MNLQTAQDQAGTKPMKPNASLHEPRAASAHMPLTVRIPEACRLTGIGRSKLYELIASGDIQTIKVGSITLIPIKALEQFLGLE